MNETKTAAVIVTVDAEAIEALKREIKRTGAERDRMVALVPDKRFCECTPSEKMRFTNLENAMLEHKAAVRAYRLLA